MIARTMESGWEVLARGLLAMAAVTIVVLTGSCSEADHTPGFTCKSGAPPAAEVVGMTCGGKTAGTTERVDIVVGGPSGGSTTVRGFNFDVTYDPANVEFVPDANYVSPLFPDAFVAVALFNGQQGRVIVSIQQPAGLPDVSFGSGESTIVSLSFRRVPGATFAPTPLNFQNADAIGAPMFIGFAAGLTLAYQ